MNFNPSRILDTMTHFYLPGSLAALQRLFLLCLSLRCLAPCLLLSGLCGGLLPAVALAAAPPANTVISNQAAASYRDANGLSRRVVSNTVQTTVGQVGALDLSNDNFSSISVGGTVYLPHTLVNAGNGTDRFKVTVRENEQALNFARIAIYPDANGTGIPSSRVPLCATETVSCVTAGFVQDVAGDGARFNFLVAYTAPAIQPMDASDSMQATVVAEPADKTSIVYETYSPKYRLRADSVTLTAGAAFSMSLSIGAPAVAAPAGNWPPPTAMGPPSAAATCSLEWSATLLQSNPGCTYTVYTLRYANRGEAAGDLTLRDPLPAGLKYVTGSAVWSGLGATALQEDNFRQVQGPDGAGLHYSFERDSETLRATLRNVEPNVSGTLSFVVLVSGSALPGTQVTTNEVHFHPQQCDATRTEVQEANCGGQDPANDIGSALQSRTNMAAFTVTQVWGVTAAGEATRVVDGVWPPLPEGLNLVQIPALAASSVANFRNVITNTGSGTDSFKLQMIVPQGNGSFPSETEYYLLHGDGITPLTDTDQDGFFDTGPMAPGASMVVTLRLRLPVAMERLDGPLGVLLIARSIGSGDTEVSDAVWNRVGAVVGSALDLTMTKNGGFILMQFDVDRINPRSCTAGFDCDFGEGPSRAPNARLWGYASVATSFDLWVNNNDTVDNAYTLAADPLPVGWTVKFVAGDASSCQDPELAQPVPVRAGAQTSLRACVTPSAAAQPGEKFEIRISARARDPSGTGAQLRDTILVAIEVKPTVTKDLTVMSDPGPAFVRPGGFSIIPVRLVNRGTHSCGATASGLKVTLTLSVQHAVRSDWSAALLHDVSGSGVPDSQSVPIGMFNARLHSRLEVQLKDAIPAQLPLQGGGELRLLIKIAAPVDALPREYVTIEFAVADPGDAACPSDSALIDVHVSDERVSVVKKQVVDQACSGGDENTLALLASVPLQALPGQCVLYEVLLRNDGTAAISNVSLSSSVPPFTRYAQEPARQPASQCVATLLSGTAVAYSPPDGSDRVVACASEANSLAPAGTVMLRYSVQIEP